MGVERVDYLSEYEYQEAQQSEAEQYAEWRHSQQEPDVVPCFVCGGQMYQECHAPEGNICSNCKSGEIEMNTCCRNQTTQFCPDCGANLEAKSLVGLRKHLFARVESAQKRLDDWIAVNSDDNNAADKVAAIQGIARCIDKVVQLESWIVELDKATA